VPLPGRSRGRGTDGAHYEVQKLARTEKPPMLSKYLIRRLQRMRDRDHRRLYLSSMGEEGRLPRSVKTGQPLATCGGFAPVPRPRDGDAPSDRRPVLPKRCREGGQNRDGAHAPRGDL